ncbi:50S ribosomal protein L37e [Halorubrum gandharaense]
MTGSGTPSQGKKNKTVHVKCRRCGEASYHLTKERCASCGFGKSAKRRDYAWQSKTGDN